MKKVRRVVGFFGCMFFLSFPSSSIARMNPRQIYQTKAAGVVLIVASQKDSASASAGTGSIIHQDGTVLTNCHVVNHEDTQAPFQVIHIFLKPQQLTGDMNNDLKLHYNGEVVACDSELDLALVKIKNPPAELAVVDLGDPSELGPGDETIAIGHPEQGGLWTITTGVIGAEFENFKGVAGKHVFQMETSLNRGNSGGPLFDVRGYQVGVNTAIARQGEGGVAITGVNFALKSSVVKEWATRHQVALAYGSENLTRRDQESGGTIRLEEDRGEDEVDAPASQQVNVQRHEESTQVRWPRYHPGKRNPIRFEAHFRTQPRPYSFKRLFSEVDRARARAEKAFDDLEREVQLRRKH